jgi:AraC-like DNA-binding protein
MTIDEVAIPSKSDTQFLLRLLHNITTQEPVYTNHSHSELEIVMFKNGGGMCLVNKTQEYVFEPGDIFLFSSNEDHIFSRFTPRENTASICIHFKPHFVWSPGNDLFDVKYLQAFFNRQPNFAHLLKHDLPVTKSVSYIMYQIEREFAKKQPEYELIIKIELLRILVEINRYYESIRQADSFRPINNQHLARIEKSMRYIDEHIDSDITLDQLSKIATMSRSYYSHLFKTLNGISPWEYLIHKRIELSEQYLLNSDDSIIEIANKCGFNNSANFNRSFRKITGNTPSQVRKSGLRYTAPPVGAAGPVGTAGFA